MPRYLTQEEFLDRCYDTHGDRYDYSKVEYVRTEQKVTIICKEHGEFQQTPAKHYIGRGCPACGHSRIANANSMITEGFIRKARAVHGDRYDYSNTVYVSTISQLTVTCKEHGEFSVQARQHLIKSTPRHCPLCLKITASRKMVNTAYGPKKITHRYNTLSYVAACKSMHGDRYDYSKVEYTGSINKVTIICPTHGQFEQIASNHLRGKWGCVGCSAAEKKLSNLHISRDYFIKQSIALHGDRYDYSKVDFINLRKKVMIICNVHGIFNMTPRAHGENGQGCPECLLSIRSDYALSKLKEVHGDRYEYELFEYKNRDSYITIICPTHGPITAQYKNILRGGGCNGCYVRDQTEYIAEARKVHGDRYDYSKVVYVCMSEKITIICRVHGEFIQSPSGHTSGSGCRKCHLDSVRKTVDKFIEESIAIHGDRYDYSKVEYKNSNDYVAIICKDHGIFQQWPANHLQGKGCFECQRDRLRSNTEEFIEKGIAAHGDRYDYSKVVYVRTSDKVTIICKEHGEFQQTPHVHSAGHGCLACANSKRTVAQGNADGVLYHPKPTTVYYIRLRDIDDMVYWKIGITTTPLVRRFGKRILDAHIDVIWTEEFDLGEPAWMLEQFILHKFNNSRVYKPHISIINGGYTEIFGDDVASDKDSLYAEYMLEMKRN